MACPTCDHTMEALPASSQADETTTFLCPRCGTVKIDGFRGDGSIVYVPKLVERCREFVRIVSGLTDEQSTARPFLLTKWRLLGVAESINKPEDRK